MTIHQLTKVFIFSTAITLTACGNTNQIIKDEAVLKKSSAAQAKPQKATRHALTYSAAGKTDADHLWLEEVEGEPALNKVKSWNSASAVKMQGDTYKAIKAQLLEVHNSPEKIPYISYRNGEAHNFWQDDKNVRGLWRKTTLSSYSSASPEWEAVLDIDNLAKQEDKNWVYKGNDCLAPTYNHCMVSLSDGGKDAVVRREFNAKTKRFVENGFITTESKGATDWLDKDTLIIGVNFGDDTMTESGYPRFVKLWKRGTPIKDAKTIYEGKASYVGSWGYTIENANGGKEIILQNSLTFFEREYFWLPQTSDNGGEPVAIPIPQKSSLGDDFEGQTLLELQEDWRGYKSGSLLSFSFEDFMKDGKIDSIKTVFAPSPRQSLNNYGVTKDAVLLSISENVAGSILAYNFDDDKWSSTKLNFPKNGAVSIRHTNDNESIAFINSESFLEPDTLWNVDTSNMSITKTRALPSWFDSEAMVAEQYFVKSTDGTDIPYFVIRQKDLKMDGTNPTILYGYGGFRISLNPQYSATIGRAWLERGGVFVIANTRGGEEFGPAWHQAGLKEKRQIIYDDFISVAEDLIARKITTPEHLGTHGRSNGGLLMGVMFTQRPELFKAMAIGVPLLDMHRYHKLLAGHSWIGEYGDPDNEGVEGEFIRNLSPYHNVDPNGEYPLPYIYTSTKDDRVHPAHARKFAQRLEDFGLPFLYYENIDGGHAGGANLDELSRRDALIYTYFLDALK